MNTISGTFFYPNNTPLANGYVLLQLLSDQSINSANGYGQVSRSIIRIDLNNIGVMPNTSIWPNDVLLPSGGQYIMRTYSQQGGLVSGPTLLTISSSPTPFIIT